MFPSNDSSERQSRVDDTRESLMRAAARLFAEKGYEATSVKELAGLAGVNVSLVSYHFGGKEGLLRACLEEFGKEGLGMAERILKEPHSMEELQIRLRLFIEEAYRMQLAQPDQSRILHRECDMEYSIAHDVFQNTFHRIFEALAGFIESARKNGLLREDIDAQIGASLLFGALIHPLRTARKCQEFIGTSIHDAPFRERVIDHLTTLFLKGFGK